MEMRTPLKSVLIDEGRRQSWLARRVGLDQPTLSRIVNGRVNATSAEQVAIAEALGHPVAKLFPPAPVDRAA